MLIMFNMMLILSFLFLWTNHPLMMVMIIISQTILVSLTIGVMLGSFWFSYIILIIMLSGMLVLFIYMASIASNEKLQFSIKLLFTLMLMFLSMNFLFTKETTLILPNNYLMIILNWLFNSKTMFITMMMVMYLLFTMITVSKIVNINEGPLRTFK